MTSSTRFLSEACFGSSVAALVLAVGSVGYAAEINGAVAAKLRADYAVARVGVNGFKFDYNHIVQPGTVLRVRIPGIYADPANTPQAIINTVIVNGEAQQQRGLLSAMSNTTQGHTFEKDEQVYVTKIDLRQDGVHFELLTAGTSMPRYRAEVKFMIPNLAAMDAAGVEQVIGRALAGGAGGGGGGADGAGVEQAGGSGVGAGAGAAAGAGSGLRSGPSRPGVAAISGAQEARIKAQVEHAPAALSKEVAEAEDTLRGFLATESCINDYVGRSQIQAYLGPHGDINAVSPPFFAMRFHDKGTCVDLTRIQGWAPLSLNAFEFQVVYTAADSGESTVRRHVAQREPDGTWLMNR